jgi:hypothetical protein
VLFFLFLHIDFSAQVKDTCCSCLAFIQSIHPASISLFMHINRVQNKLAGLAKTAPWLLIAISLAVLLVFALLARYSHPSSDDFCMASGVDEYGLFRQLWDHYFEWSGRYTGNALYAIYPLIFGLFGGYKYIPAVMMLALFSATAYFLSALFRIRGNAGPVLLVSLCFTATFLLGMLSPASSLYWMAGAMSYQSANILFLVLLGLMIRLYDRQKTSKNYRALFTVLLLVIVLAMGTNETSMLALTGLALLGVVVQLRSGLDVLKPWLLILALALVCFAIVYYSPGNAIRAADFPLRHDLVRSINGSLAVGLKILWRWLSNPVLIVSSMLVPFAISKLLQMSDRCFTVSRTVIVALLSCTFLVPVLLQFPAWWSMGGWPPPRTVDAIYFLFIVGWYLTIAALTVRYLHMGKWQSIMQPYKPGVAVVLLLLSVLFTVAVLQSKSYQLARNDLFQLAPPYHEYMKQRYRVIEQAVANGQSRLAVADYRLEYPRTIYFNDIMHNPDDWRNDCYADYFGLEKIKRGSAK